MRHREREKYVEVKKHIEFTITTTEKEKHSAVNACRHLRPSKN